MTAAALLADLRWLVGHAVATGADPERVELVAGQLVDLLLDAQDPRRRESLALAERVHKAKAAGTSMAGLCERFSRSRSQINRLDRMWRMTSRATSAVQSGNR